MKILRIILAITVACLLGGCVAFDVQTPYGSASSDGKTVRAVVLPLPAKGLAK